MMNCRIFCAFVFGMLSTLVLCAQDQAYTSVSCVKVQPGKLAEFTNFQHEVVKKIVQVEADENELTSWFLSRVVFPSGEEARCDYMVFTSYGGIPPTPEPDWFTGVLQRAGIHMTVGAYRLKAAEVERTISTEMFRQFIMLGTVQKGDYIYLNFMKVHDTPGYFDFERTIYKPVAEGFLQDGTFHAWMVLQSFLPGGTGLPYQAISADIFPSWKRAFEGDNSAEMFKKVHPEIDPQELHDKMLKLRDLDRRYFVTVEDVAAPATKRSNP
jgi:hypothetical protein